MKVFLVIHTTSGIEFELVEERNGEPNFDAKSLSGRCYVCDDDDDDDTEGLVKDEWIARIARKGWELVGECWS